MDIYPGQAEIEADGGNLVGGSLKGMYRRINGGTLHLLPLNGNYCCKRDAEGNPIFVLTDLKPERDDVVLDFPNDVQHAERR